MKLPTLFVPAAVVVFAALCIPLREVFNYPAATVTFAESETVDAAQVRTAEMIVQGVKCKGTANFFLMRYQHQDGILGLEAFAADHKVVVTYDATQIDADRIREIGEAPVLTQDGQLRRFFVVEELRDR